MGGLTLDDVTAVLRSGLEESETEKRNLALWRRTAIDPKRLRTWVDEDLKRAWGFKAAARAFHIASTGRDVTVGGPFKEHSPTTVSVKPSGPVPGAPDSCQNLFDLSQVLAWLAQDRHDIQERLSWREQIADILVPFIPAGQLEIDLGRGH